ncbi:MAG: pyridoxamine 5'-phosphate oxidase family protein [Actinomycetota bacterium]|nr:pyridoxamine 5'-phosphate oxidase family protein [Actinomycetota bacterium]
MEELAQMARDVIDSNRYLVLGTSQDDGRPRVSPVYYTHVGYREFYWVSSPKSHHSRNVEVRSEVSFVIFNSTLLPTQNNHAVYVDATAAQVPEAELEDHCARAFATVGPGTRAFAPEELSGDGDLRLYLARATRHQVHVRGGDPTYGTGNDRRETVDP